MKRIWFSVLFLGVFSSIGWALHNRDLKSNDVNLHIRFSDLRKIAFQSSQDQDFKITAVPVNFQRSDELLKASIRPSHSSDEALRAFTLEFSDASFLFKPRVFLALGRQEQTFDQTLKSLQEQNYPFEIISLKINGTPTDDFLFFEDPTAYALRREQGPAVFVNHHGSLEMTQESGRLPLYVELFKKSRLENLKAFETGTVFVLDKNLAAAAPLMWLPEEFR